ncbi:MAG TPA: AAA family ATPase [Geoalkalibacter subterraneus]|uniref:AAA family ATPase n=1 Tax=Geoalkalibacter subterraneus TaxID=483547 RepID=A0A831PK30_9BACT|nr:AAA family ATPase [Geoalkalibacter subterraneus]
MNIDIHRLKALIAKGEGLDVEFKACRDQLPKSVYETVCAFLNRHGGTLLMGVADGGSIQGIDPTALEQVRKNFVTAINNPQKLTPPTYLSINDAELDGKKLLHIYVPESSQVHRCNGRIYDRNEDGDLDITDHTEQVAQLYQRKQASYSENRILPHLTLDDLERELIAKCRKVATLRWEDHPWKDLDDLELLKSAQLYQTSPESGVSGITLAGILLLGKQLPLLNTIPHHRTDLILRKVNLDRYDDRDFVDVNLVESYERIMAFIHKHLPDPFYLEGTTSISIRDAIFREVASNILIHREYTNAFPAKLIIEYGQVRTENSSRPHGFGRLDPETFTPFPKNPVIAKFFRQIGRADELGSGMRKLMKYSRAYGGADPELTEGDVFRIVIQVPEHSKRPEPVAADTPSGPQVTPQAVPQVTPQVKKLLPVLTNEMDRQQILQALGLKARKNLRVSYLEPALKHGLIEMTQPDSPNSPTQKYRLTTRGKKLLKELKK